jgi:seryl-tRNA synthetase
MSDLEKALVLGLVAVAMSSNMDKAKALFARVRQALKPKPRADKHAELMAALDADATEADRRHQEAMANLDALSTALVSATNGQAHEVYVQSLATLSKGISAIIERQEKLEQQLILLVSNLNRLTGGQERE